MHRQRPLRLSRKSRRFLGPAQSERKHSLLTQEAIQDQSKSLNDPLDKELAKKASPEEPQERLTAVIIPCGEWPVEQFAKCGIHLEPAENPESDIYIDLVPLINSRAVRLLDHDRMMNQFVGLERTSVCECTGFCSGTGERLWLSRHRLPAIISGSIFRSCHHSRSFVVRCSCRW